MIRRHNLSIAALLVLGVLLVACSSSSNVDKFIGQDVTAEDAVDTVGEDDVEMPEVTMDLQPDNAVPDLAEDLVMPEVTEELVAEVVCQPDCDGKECGPDGCEGTCGTCDGQDLCVEGECQCVPDCGDSVCGDDGCDGSCGECGDFEECLEGACLCAATECPDECCETDEAVCFGGGCCLPDCEGKSCGGDGCGELCGDCEEGAFCIEGECTDVCPEPMCELGDTMCNPSGTGWFECFEMAEPCEAVFMWTEVSQPCEAGLDCVEGECVCIPDCEGKVCGDDGCEGSCGECADQEACIEGACQCVPMCEGMECGDDGCGAQCGACEGQDVCVEGLCECMPDCEGNICGDDGCGGSCGSCAEGCTCEGGQCMGECNCVPQCDGKACGDDGCGAQCGSCDDEDPCTIDSCNPDTFQCDNVLPECDDGNMCTSDQLDPESCECVFMPDPCICEDPCTECSCDPAAGDCIVEPIECTDEDPCTEDSCVDGACIFTAKNCDDNDPCTDDSCAPDSGDCVNTEVVCGDDNDVCTGTQTCQGGQCVSDGPLDCVDQDPCTKDLCDPADGCLNPTEADGTPCGEPQFECQDGLCICVPACENKQCGPDGCGGSCGACDDGLWCNGEETCGDNGQCVAGVAIACDDANDCTKNECDEDGDTCKYTDEMDGTECFVGGNYECMGGDCVCVPDCAGKQCGDNGCGADCGSCNGDEVCIDDVCVDPYTCVDIMLCAQNQCNFAMQCTMDNCYGNASGAAKGLFETYVFCLVGQCGFSMTQQCVTAATTGACASAFGNCAAN